MLLRLEAVHIDRQFRRGDYVRQKNKFPARQLRAITQVKIFRQRIVLPATRFIDARAAPEPGRAVEIEKTSAPAARCLLEQEMAVEEHRLHPRKQRITAIQ